jgi:uncharacterized protein
LGNIKPILALITIPSGNTEPIRYDYVKREVMIPMRDGVKLYTVIAIPKGATHAPIVLTRTPLRCRPRMNGGWSRAYLARRS